MPPLEAALKGSREIGFTIMSMTLSLSAVFIPVLFMGGIVGRLFHEFAVTISAAILISGFVSLTLTPMLCSRFLQAQSKRRARRLSRPRKSGFDAAARLCATLAGRLRVAPIVARCDVPSATLAPRSTSSVVPKGFFPERGYRLIFAITEAAQDTSFDGHGDGRRRWRPSSCRTRTSMSSIRHRRDGLQRRRHTRDVLHQPEAAGTAQGAALDRSSSSCARQRRFPG